MKKKINKARLREQLRLVAVSLALAIIVWMTAKVGETREATLTVPVNVTGLRNQVEMQVIPSEMPVVVRYGREANQYISSENFRLVVDVTNMQDDIGLSWKPVTIGLSEKNWEPNIPSARGVKLVKIGHQSSTVDIRMRYNAVPAAIIPDIVGAERLPEGFQLVSPIKVTPREVYLIGDVDKLASLVRDEITGRIQLKTEPISVAGRTESSLETVDILLPQGISIVQRRSNTVDVNLEIQEVQTLREISGVPLVFRALAPEIMDMQYEPKNATVTVFGPPSLLNQLSADSFRVTPVRPLEEVPGSSRNIALEYHFAPSVTEEIRTRVTLRSIRPDSLQVNYIVRENGQVNDEATTPSTENNSNQ